MPGVAQQMERTDATFVAAVIPLPRRMMPVIGMGAFLKNTVTLIDGERAFVSQSIGHTDTLDAIVAMEEMARRLIDFTGVRPQVIAG